MKHLYIEMGSKNKKTGKLSYYQVTLENGVINDCGCPARNFHPYSPCKHMKRLHAKLGHKL